MNSVWVSSILDGHGAEWPRAVRWPLILPSTGIAHRGVAQRMGLQPEDAPGCLLKYKIPELLPIPTGSESRRICISHGPFKSHKAYEPGISSLYFVVKSRDLILASHSLHYFRLLIPYWKIRIKFHEGSFCIAIEFFGPRAFLDLCGACRSVLCHRITWAQEQCPPIAGCVGSLRPCVQPYFVVNPLHAKNWEQARKSAASLLLDSILQQLLCLQ